MKRGRARFLLLPLLETAPVGLASLGALFLLRRRIPTWSLALLPPGVDGHYYAAMAEGALRPCLRAPFCWRPVVPVFAGMLPFEITPAFVSVNLVLLALTATVLYWFLRSALGSRLWAIVGVLLYASLGWATKFLFLYPWLTDAGLFLATVVAMYAAQKRRPILFAIALAIGILTKEAVLVTLGLYYGLNARRVVDLKVLGETALVAVPAVIVAVGVRLVLPGSFRLGEGLALGRHHLEELDTWSLWRTITFGTWGLVTSLGALVGLLRAPGLALRLAPFLAGAYAQLAIAHDTERLLVVAFPAVVWLGVVGLRALTPPALALALAVATFASTFLFVLPPFGPPGEAVQLLAVAIAGLVLIALRLIGFARQRVGGPRSLA